MESIGIVLKDIMGNSAVFIAGKEAVIVSAVSIVISVFIGILGLKLIRVWNAVIGFVAGALLGFAVRPTRMASFTGTDRSRSCGFGFCNTEQCI